ncbi:MAG: 50S ribosomal protein L4 [Kiritimatiellaeota bacterium]|nr:50S ribosomal protein L4 [Kiritimatiellota bacterium]
MNKLTLYNARGDKSGEVAFPEELLIRRRGEQAVHDAVVAYLANQRLGTAKPKKRGEVSGGGIKPFKQKGTGRARAGSIRSPIWRGGGVVFGPQPRDYSQKLNKRVARLAFARALSEKLTAGQVLVVDQLELAEPKTRLLLAVLKKMNVTRGVLLVMATVTRNLALAARNLDGVALASAAKVHTYQVLRYPHLVVSQAALEQLEKRMALPDRSAS